jgi:hypothetical protein
MDAAVDAAGGMTVFICNPVSDAPRGIRRKTLICVTLYRAIRLSKRKKPSLLGEGSR